MAIRIAGGGGATTPATATPWVRTGTSIFYDPASVTAGVVTVQIGGPNTNVPVNQTLQGQGSRAGTDNNTAGATTTIASGQGTGTGAASSLIFQTPTLVGAGSGAQTMTTGLRISKGGISGGAGDFDAVTFGILGSATVVIGGGSSEGVSLRSIGFLAWTSSANTAAFASRDLFLGRAAAATLQLGAANAAAPIAQTLQAQGSRAGTDNDIGGANLTVASGQGTGTGAASSLIFQTPTLVGAGSGAQTMATRLTVATTAITGTVQFIGPDGTAAAPSFRVTSDATGIYRVGSNRLGLSAGGSWRAEVSSGGFQIDQTIPLTFTSAAGVAGDVLLTRGGAATLQLGSFAADLAAVNQTLRAQGVLVGGTADQAGGNLAIASGQGKGAGAISTITLLTPALGVSGTVLQTMGTRVTVDQNQTTVRNRLNTSMGANVVAANDLTLGVDGNLFTITGNTQVNAITTAQWTAGARFTLLFTGTPTVKHNTAGGAGTAVIFLQGSVDLVAANNTLLTLVYDGTQFQEVARKVA